MNKFQRDMWVIVFLFFIFSLLIVILYYLVVHINILQSGPCMLCENKTGRICVDIVRYVEQ